MEQYLIWIALSSLWIWGFNLAFQEGEILGKPGEWINRHLPEWIVKPTIGCPLCMASIHGTGWYLFAWWGSYHFVFHILFVVCVCGLNTVIYKLTDR